MGSFVSKALSSLSAYFGQRQAKILILGLDNAGKTTILYRLQLDENVETVSTLAFNAESIEYQNIKFQVWDLGGQMSIRQYWRCYFLATSAVIFVVDSTDTARMDVAKEELQTLDEEEGLENAVFVIFANKQDAPGALSAAQLAEELELSKIRNRSWSIFNTSAVTGVGINEGLDWLCAEIMSK
ncbi:ADP-ribosylation factor [Gregarina niphandrodes]|uniref:ADP-ribosylation factor n=1 Tax=Gregarina niphandrodes TaxID=110365 RepID=A0A023B858_GRENI|nr:ADP-ribosylation factor [Gregarina niphandrodes]EZG68195.1 ADP-ribosylation factor [Gregarina niphandrodes]|eukprot:XP_011130043.1 ADP-ribosylation factor [Gregarina niphandrodes]